MSSERDNKSICYDPPRIILRDKVYKRIEEKMMAKFDKTDIADLNHRIAELESQLEQIDLARKCLIYDNQKLIAKLDAVRGVRDYCTDYPQYHKTVLKHVVAKLDAALGEDK